MRDGAVNRMRQKMKSGSGFTLGELLIAAAILVMISAGLLPAAMRAYRGAVDAANAHILLSTTVSALRNELSTARDVKQVSGSTTEITYVNAYTGSQTRMYLDSSVIMLQEYNDRQGTPTYLSDAYAAPDARPLVSSALNKTIQNSGDPDKGLKVVYTGVTPDATNGTVTITGLKVQRDGSDVVSISQLIIRPLGGISE